MPIRRVNLVAVNKVVATGSGVGDDIFVIAVAIEDDSVWSRAATGVGLVAAQDGEFVVGSAVRERESLIVVVLVRVSTRSAAGVQVPVALIEGSVDIGLVVAGAATCLDARLALE